MGLTYLLPLGQLMADICVKVTAVAFVYSTPNVKVSKHLISPPETNKTMALVL
jgi:hypothetical protein